MGKCTYWLCLQIFNFNFKSRIYNYTNLINSCFKLNLWISRPLTQKPCVPSGNGQGMYVINDLHGSSCYPKKDTFMHGVRKTCSHTIIIYSIGTTRAIFHLTRDDGRTYIMGPWRTENSRVGYYPRHARVEKASPDSDLQSCYAINTSLSLLCPHLFPYFQKTRKQTLRALFIF